MRESAYEVVWPLGKLVYEVVTSAPRISDFRGKTICALWDWLFKGEDIFPMIKELLQKRYPGIKFVDYTAFGNTHGGKQAEVVAALPDRLSEQGCDAIISGIGN